MNKGLFFQVRECHNKNLFVGLLTCLLIFINLTQLGCQSTPTNTDPSTTYTISPNDYEDVIENNTDQATEYDGLHNTLEVHATMLNTQVSQALSKRKATTLNWNKEQFDKDYTDRFLINSKNTEFFVSFFTPERKNNDLTRSETLWKVVLTSKGQRFEGKVTKLNLLNSEIQNLYPYHTHWNNPYIVSFNVPLSEVEPYTVSLSISGPLASKTLNFNKDSKK